MGLASDNEREKIVLKSLVAILRDNLNPPRILLFGSRGKGVHRKGSDFDIAVDMEKPSPKRQRELLEQIDRVLGLYSADIIYLKSVDKDFGDLVRKTGKVIYEAGN